MLGHRELVHARTRRAAEAAHLGILGTVAPTTWITKGEEVSVRGHGAGGGRDLARVD